MEELLAVRVNEKQEPIISGRMLHEFLEIKTPYTQWFNRMVEYGFIENIDFATVSQKCEIANGGYGKRNINDTKKRKRENSEKVFYPN